MDNVKGILLQQSTTDFFLFFVTYLSILGGLKLVDKIKKYCCDIPRGFSLTFAVDCHLCLRVQ